VARGGGESGFLNVLEDEESEGRFRRKPFFQVLRTSAFRYIIFGATLFVVGVSLLGFIVYESTIGAAFDRIEEELADELTRLELVSMANGAPSLRGLESLINEAEGTKLPISSRYVIFLEDERSAQPIAGSLQGVPVAALDADGPFEFSWTPPRPIFGTENPSPRRYLGLTRTLVYERPRGGEVRAIVLLARDIEELNQLRRMREDIVLRVIGVTLLLAVVLGGILGTALVRRLDSINRSVEAITEGDLTRRLPVSGSGDEFDSLARNINLMLDRIEQLMIGMRQVSDNIAHDLRSPLTRIKARLDSAIEDGGDELDPDDADILERTRTDVERLLATFNALLSITRIEAGTGVLEGNVDLRGVAEEMLELYVPAADDAGFELVADLQDAPSVQGSRELISQAIANLLDNAMKYARHPEESRIKPKIELTVAPRPAGGALLSVMDNGPGVSERDRERIVQRFVRLERSRSTTGNGLGLSLVAAIVRRHGGQLSIGRGLPHDPSARSLNPSSAYGLGIRIAFPPVKTVKKSSTALASRSDDKTKGA
jgi:signal transduction histidine kinase